MTNSIKFLLSLARHPEPVIRILKLRRNAGPGCAAADLDVMPPRTAARSAPRASLRTDWVSLRRGRIVVRRIPIAAPLVNIFADIVQAEPVWSRFAYRFRSCSPALHVIRTRLWRFISPGKQLTFDSSACRSLPLRLRGQSKTPTRSARQPFAIPHGVEP